MPPKPMTFGSRSNRRFVKQDFRYVSSEDVYIRLAGERPTYRSSNEETGWMLRSYWSVDRDDGEQYARQHALFDEVGDLVKTPGRHTPKR